MLIRYKGGRVHYKVLVNRKAFYFTKSDRIVVDKISEASFDVYGHLDYNAILNALRNGSWNHGSFYKS